MTFGKDASLPQGLSLVVNTGPPERVLTAAEWERLRDE